MFGLTLFVYKYLIEWYKHCLFQMPEIVKQYYESEDQPLSCQEITNLTARLKSPG